MTFAFDNFIEAIGHERPAFRATIRRGADVRRVLYAGTWKKKRKPVKPKWREW